MLRRLFSNLSHALVAVAALAALVLSMTDVGRIERGERDPSVKTVARLARGLGVSPGELFEGVE